MCCRADLLVPEEVGEDGDGRDGDAVRRRGAEAATEGRWGPCPFQFPLRNGAVVDTTVGTVPERSKSDAGLGRRPLPPGWPSRDGWGWRLPSPSGVSHRPVSGWRGPSRPFVLGPGLV